MTAKPTKCIICNGDNIFHWFNKNSYPILRCRNCNSAFVFPIPGDQALLDFYTNDRASTLKSSTLGVQEQFNQLIHDELSYPNSTIDAARISSYLRQLSDGGKALDIGAGYGFFSRSLICEGFEVDSTELNNHAIAMFKVMNGFEPKNLSFNAQFAHNNINEYDVVLMSQVLEHLPLNNFPIRNVNMTLKENGICAVAVPHFRSYFSMLQNRDDMFITPPEHINFFTKEGLIQAFELEGFKLIKIHTVSRFDRKKIKYKFGIFAPLIISILILFFKFSDLSNQGIFINAYFKKISNSN